MNTVDSIGQNILIKCKNIAPVVNSLIRHKINLNQTDIYGKTALQYFIDEIITPPTININGQELPTKDLNRDYKEEIKLLKSYVENGAFVGKERKNGWHYIYEQAQLKNNIKLTKYLEKYYKSEIGQKK